MDIANNTATNCKDCADNTYTGEFGASSNASCMSCAHTQYSVGGVPCIDLNCSSGYYAANHACVACPAGQYNDLDGNRAVSCKYCDSGQYQNATGMRACLT